MNTPSAKLAHRRPRRRETALLWMAGLSFTVGVAFLFESVRQFAHGPGPLSAICFLIAFATLLCDRRARRSRWSQRLTFALSGTLPPAGMENWLRLPVPQRLAPSAHPVTLVLIDVIGLATAVEKRNAPQAFELTRVTLERIARAVFAHGGTIQPSAGDGIVAVFGHPFGAPSADGNHAAEGLRCALAIQRDAVRDAVGILPQNEFFPLRIGIHTARVYLGDLGLVGRPELVVLGDGVDLAKRLQSTCEPLHILVSASTRNLIPESLQRECGLRPRMVTLKNYSALVEVYDGDPFASDRTLRKKASDAHRLSIRRYRSEQRWPVAATKPIVARTSFGEGVVVDFSRRGISLALPRYLGNGVVVEVHLGERDEELHKKLSELGLVPLLYSVRWAAPAGRDRYLHGLALQLSGVGQQQAVFTALRQHMIDTSLASPLVDKKAS